MHDPVNRNVKLKRIQRDANRRSISAAVVTMLSTAPLTAFFVLTLSILVIVLAINQILRHFCGTTKIATVVASAVIPAASAIIMLIKRARWSFPMGRIGAGLIIAAAAYATPYLVAAVCYSVSSGACAPISGGIIAAGAVVAAAVVAGLEAPAIPREA